MESAGQQVVQHVFLVATVDGADVAHEGALAPTTQDLGWQHVGECGSRYRAISSTCYPHPAWRSEACLDYGLGK